MATTTSPSRTIFTNPSASSYLIPPGNTPQTTEISNFHASLPEYSNTPLISLPTIANSIKIGNLLIKDERVRFNLPSFKPLGIAWAIRNALIAELSESLSEPLSSEISLSELATKTKEAQIKLITATDGKLGRIVARLGKHFGVESINTRIFVPEDLEESVKHVIKAEGAEVLVAPGDFEVAVREAWLHSVATDGILVNIDSEENYVDIPKWIVDGYSTIFNELDSQVSSSPPDLIVLPVGVGGLAQAAITHYKSSKTQPANVATRFLTVEPEAAACFHSSLRAGKRVDVESKETILKHLNYNSVAESAWEILKGGVDASAVVTDQEVTEAMAEFKSQDLDMGPCGGAVLAALKVALADDGLGRSWELDENSTVVLICTEGGQP